METIKNRYEFVYLFDVENGNPNGDPDAGNMPRIDAETSHGIVTDVCLKRKIRNYTEIIHEDKAPNCIYVKEKSVLTKQQEKSYIALQNEGIAKPSIEEAKNWMCKNFFDVRTFGAVMSTKENNCGQVRGPVQLAFSESIDPIVPLEATITRMAVETKKEADAQGGDNRTMGRKTYVPYGLYRVHGFLSAPLAKQTGFSEEDLELFWDALVNMFDHDRSAARGEMASQKLFIFKHDKELGNTPAHKLFELIQVKRISESNPARKFSDYEVKVDKSNVPGGVTLQEML